MFCAPKSIFFEKKHTTLNQLKSSISGDGFEVVCAQEPIICHKIIILRLNRVGMGRYGLILGEIEAGDVRKLFKHLPDPREPIFHPKTSKNIENPKNLKIQTKNLYSAALGFVG